MVLVSSLAAHSTEAHKAYVLVQDFKLKALIEAKGLRLKSVQQQLRTDVTREHQLLQSCQPEVLMDWRMCRLADPDFIQPDMLYKEPTPAVMAPRISPTAQLELARYRCYATLLLCRQ